VTRPLVNFEGIPHPNWLVGFVDGEGCFYVNTKKAKSKLGIQVISTFFISQHSRDELLLSKIIDYLGCGSIEKSSTRLDETKFIVYKFSDIFDKVIPFFKNHPLQSVKNLDFQDFCLIANLMKNKDHLNPKGLEKISLIKSRMNSARILD
jgi:hypothetical protein